MNIKDKLKQFHQPLISEKERITSSSQDQIIPEHWINLASLSGGEIIREGSGYFFYRQRSFDISTEPGYKDILNNNLFLEKLSILVPDENLRNYRLNDLLFFDLETSGLAGGTGTVAFMIGAAHLSMHEIVVHQWIMPDYIQEHLILKQFNFLAGELKALASFNGKTFDLPLLSNRFILNRLIPSFEDYFHLDILHPSRRLWGSRLESCRLQYLEKEILKDNRIEDIPGELIPSVYFNFLYGMGVEDFNKILEHNYLDLVNLVRLILRTEYLLNQPSLRMIPDDQYRLIDLLMKQKKYKEAMEIISAIGSDEKLALPILIRKARLLKKSGEYQSACHIYENLMDMKHQEVEIIEEYAKIMEHHIRNYRPAIDAIRRKLKSLEIISELYSKDEYRVSKQLKKRLKRLEEKLKRQTIHKTN